MSNENKIRTIGLYQPYAFLMLHGKIETRWVIKGKKPPFPLGNYLIYATQKAYMQYQVKQYAGESIAATIFKLQYQEPYSAIRGKSICVGTLVDVRLMTPEDCEKCFVKWETSETHDRWCLVFENIKRVVPEPVKGKQGIGFIESSKISYCNE